MITFEERLIQDGHPPDTDAVLFYGITGENRQGSNFKRGTLIMRNPWTGVMCEYKSGEHRFQAIKGTSLRDHEYVRSASTCVESKNRGRSIPLRPGWGREYGDFCYYVMLETILNKVRQIPEARAWLLSTGSRPIYEDSPVDDIWGVRKDGSYHGKNLLGMCWMEVRDTLTGYV